MGIELMGMATAASSSAQQSCAEAGQPEFALHGRHRPAFVTVTLLLCTAALLWEFYENGRTHALKSGESSEDCHFRLDIGDAVFCAAAFSVNPLFGPTTDVLIKMGAGEGALTVHNREVWRLVTPMYLHGGVVHFALNMLVFCKFGKELERNHGFFRIAAVYLLSGVFGILVGLALSPHSVKVGASGAIFGLFGALVGEVLQNWGLYRRPCRAVIELLVCVAIQLLLGTMPMLDNFSHLFGFIMGFFCSMLLLVMKRQTSEGVRLGTRCHQRLFQVAALASILACFLVAIALAFGPADANELCPWCSMISCIPFPWGCDPYQKGSCWGWDCLATELAGCSGSASWIGSRQNGTVVIRCPKGLSQTHDIQVWPVDLSTWTTSTLTELCKDHCPRSR